MTTRVIPRADFAIVCGSANWGLRFPEDLDEPGVTVVERDLEFDTPWGPSAEWKVLEIDGSRTSDGKARTVLTVFSHGWPLDRIDHEAHRRVFWLLQEAGVRKVIACSTAGSLNRAVFAGDFVIASDMLELTQTQHSLLPSRYHYNCSGKQLVCPACASIMEATAKSLWSADARVFGPRSRMVAAHAWGPRLTSPAEVTAYRSLGADFINHSLAPEATLAREIGACFVNCAFITAAFENYFSPPEEKLLGVEEGALRNMKLAASRIALRAIVAFDAEGGCACSSLRSPMPEDYAGRR
jgi:5'-methylthioadenosine phosphorylase